MLKSASRRLLDAIAARDREATRSRLKPWRAWYATAEWRRIHPYRLSIEPLCHDSVKQRQERAEDAARSSGVVG